MAAALGILQFTARIRAARSLKDKRRVVKSMKDRIRNRHNVSVAEVDDLDVIKQATLAVAMVGNDRVYIESSLTKMLDQLLYHPEAELVDHTVEIL